MTTQLQPMPQPHRFSKAPVPSAWDHHRPPSAKRNFHWACVHLLERPSKPRWTADSQTLLRSGVTLSSLSPHLSPGGMTQNRPGPLDGTASFAKPVACEADGQSGGKKRKSPPENTDLLPTATQGQIACHSYLSAPLPIVPTRWVFRGLPDSCRLSVPERRGGGGMWGVFGKPLKKAIWNTLGLHAVLTICLRFLSVLDDACVACCVFLSTGSYCPQTNSLQRLLLSRMHHKSLWCVKGLTLEVHAGDSAPAWQPGKKALYSQFTATCMHPRGTPDSVHRRGRFFCKSILGS